MRRGKAQSGLITQAWRERYPPPLCDGVLVVMEASQLVALAVWVRAPQDTLRRNGTTVFHPAVNRTPFEAWQVRSLLLRLEEGSYKVRS
jgi:hypothetical protein